MEIRLRTAAAAISLVLIAGLPAVAQSAQDGYYLFAAVGNADTRFRPSQVDVVDDDDSAFDIGAGLQLTDHIGVQIAYHDFGEPIGFAGCPPEVLCIQAFVPERVAVDGWSTAMVGNLPLGERVSLYGKLGLLAWDASARSPSLDDSGEDLLLGAGITVGLSQRWGLQLGWEKVDLDITSTRLGAVFRF